MARTLIDNLGPNEVCIYSVPGKRNRATIDTTYEVDAIVERGGEWETVGRFPDGRLALAYAQGYKQGARDTRAMEAGNA